MDLFKVLEMISGLALFLYGMHVMSAGLEKSAGNRLKSILATMTSSTLRGFFLGLGVTTVIQSSSATTVMVVGFVNSGVMTLKQAIGVIFGANLGTSVTSWILSMSSIDGDALWIKMLKPSSFTPIIALIGIILLMFVKNAKKKDVGVILLGFAVLMFGMDTMSAAVSGLKEVPGFVRMFTLFENPIAGVLVGTILTAIIQSSSASVGILQALATTGSISYLACFPIIMGQNIGTCVTALISSVGATKNARRAALVHLIFNVCATLVELPLFYLVYYIFKPEIVNSAASPVGIAVVHTCFKLLALVFFLPMTNLLEKMTYKIVPEGKEAEKTELLDTRLLATPTVAVVRCKAVAMDMAKLSVTSLQTSLKLLDNYDAKVAEQIRAEENLVDMYEDKLGSYMVQLAAVDMTKNDSDETSKLLHVIGDFERISDHAVNIMESATEIYEKKVVFSEDAQRELSVMVNAVSEILDMTLKAFVDGDLDTAIMIEPLEQVVDLLREQLKKQHIMRLKQGVCTIELGFVHSDIINNLERISDHCSNIAGCILEMSHESMDMHSYLRNVKEGNAEEFNRRYEQFKVKYTV
ncbi:MAG: Na/Pi cotransporter family protein [Ruminococcaceae bacterium]|nr:Na/Pi cotransporter family protein [Oscillospiraceae bacterium]